MLMDSLKLSMVKNIGDPQEHLSLCHNNSDQLADRY
jgi:hypothetical protein